MVYVDDFLMASHEKDKKTLWDPIRKEIRLAEPTGADRFLGCYTRRFETQITDYKDILSILPSQWTRLDDEGKKRTAPIPWKPKDPNKVVQCFEYDMSTYFEGVLDKYCMIKGISRDKLGTAATPFLDEAQDKSCVDGSDSESEQATHSRQKPPKAAPVRQLDLRNEIAELKSMLAALAESRDSLENIYIK